MLSSRFVHLCRVPSFAMNQVFHVVADHGELFLKVAPEEDLRREAAVLALLARRGVPVPEIAAEDLTGEHVGAPCLLLRRVRGRRLRGDERAFGAAGSLLRRVHDLDLPGFGSVREQDGRLSGEDSTWSATLRRRCGDLSPMVDASLLPAELAERAVAAVESHEPLVAHLTTGCLLHGDFHPRHLYAEHGQIAGIIDWGDATVGDSLYDVGRLFYAGLVAGDAARGYGLVRALLSSYGPVPERLRKHPELLAVYAVVFGLWSMSGEFEGGAPWPPWWPRACTALSKAVNELERHRGFPPVEEEQ